jgi:hypothetical protein
VTQSRDVLWTATKSTFGAETAQVERSSQDGGAFRAERSDRDGESWWRTNRVGRCRQAQSRLCWLTSVRPAAFTHPGIFLPGRVGRRLSARRDTEREKEQEKNGGEKRNKGDERAAHLKALDEIVCDARCRRGSASQPRAPTWPTRI